MKTISRILAESFTMSVDIGPSKLVWTHTATSSLSCLPRLSSDRGRPGSSIPAYAAMAASVSHASDLSWWATFARARATALRRGDHRHPGSTPRKPTEPSPLTPPNKFGMRKAVPGVCAAGRRGEGLGSSWRAI